MESLVAKVYVLSKESSSQLQGKEVSRYLKLLTCQRIDSWAQASGGITRTTGELPDHSSGLSQNFQNSF